MVVRNRRALRGVHLAAVTTARVPPISRPFSQLRLPQGDARSLSARGEAVIPEHFKTEQIVGLRDTLSRTFFCGGPPAIYAGLLAGPTGGVPIFRHSGCARRAGAPFRSELMERWRRDTGLEIYAGYGMSEIAPIRRRRTERDGLRPGSAASRTRNRCAIVELELGCGCCRPVRRASCVVRGRV